MGASVTEGREQVNIRLRASRRYITLHDNLGLLAFDKKLCWSIVNRKRNL